MENGTKQQQAILCADCGACAAQLGESLCVECANRDKKKCSWSKDKDIQTIEQAAYFSGID